MKGICKEKINMAYVTGLFNEMIKKNPKLQKYRDIVEKISNKIKAIDFAKAEKML